jgi:hypothetical protein
MGEPNQLIPNSSEMVSHVVDKTDTILLGLFGWLHRSKIFISDAGCHDYYANRSLILVGRDISPGQDRRPLAEPDR